MKNLNELEEKVLVKFLVGDNPTLLKLRQQLPECSVTERKFTGVGFFSKLSVAMNVNRDIGLNLILSDVTADMDSLCHGAGFVLYIEDGLLSELEGFTYDEDWPENIETFELNFMGKEARDWTKINLEIRNALK